MRAPRHLGKGGANTLAVRRLLESGDTPTLVLCESLARRGFRAVPHVSARLIGSRDHLEEIAGRLASAGIREVFAVGGDSAEPAGPHTLNLWDPGLDWTLFTIASYPLARTRGLGEETRCHRSGEAHLGAPHVQVAATEVVVRVPRVGRQRQH